MKIENVHADYNKFSLTWQKCLDIAAGQEVVKSKGELYLPTVGADEDDYKAYKDRAFLYNATGRTVEAFIGMAMRKEASIEVTEDNKELLEDVNLNGESIGDFLEKILAAILLTGRGAILTEYDQVPEGVKTQAEADKIGARPYLTFLDSLSIVDWRKDWVKIKETFHEIDPEDEFNLIPIQQYRVFDLFGEGEKKYYRQRIYRKEKETGKFALHSEIFPTKNGQKFETIPLFWVGGRRNTPDVDNAPLLDLVNANLCHYQIFADYRNGIHFAGFPQLWVTGHSDDETDLILGSSIAWEIPDPNARVGYAEATGKGLTYSENTLNRLEMAMGKLGAHLLLEDKKVAETAERAGIMRSGESATLAAIVKRIERAIQKAVDVLFEWKSLPKINIELNKDFVANDISPQKLNALVGALQSGAISRHVFFHNIKKDEMTPTDWTEEQELDQIENESGPDEDLIIDEGTDDQD